MNWFVQVCLLVLLIWCSDLVDASRARDRTLAFSNLQTTCQDLCQGGISPDERVNCVSKCLSPSCFEKVYARQPLEDGEIDEFRKGRFNACLNAERRLAKDDAKWKGEENVSEKERAMRDSEWVAKAL